MGDEGFTNTQKRYLARLGVAGLRYDESQRWNSYLEARSPSLLQRPYRHTHSRLVQAAEAKPPQTAGVNVTDFSDWVFSLYHVPWDPRLMAQGEYGERQISDERQVRLSISAPTRPGWRMIYDGINTEGREARTISALTVEGKPLRGSPDFVFQEAATRRVVIVEIKVSNRAEIPSDGWPNLRAQLWAYAHIDEWRDCPEVVLVGEVWRTDAVDGIHRRAALRWELLKGAFHSENLELFHLYGGKYVGR